MLGLGFPTALPGFRGLPLGQTAEDLRSHSWIVPLLAPDTRTCLRSQPKLIPVFDATWQMYLVLRQVYTCQVRTFGGVKGGPDSAVVGSWGRKRKKAKRKEETQDKTPRNQGQAKLNCPAGRGGMYILNIYIIDLMMYMFKIYVIELYLSLCEQFNFV